MKILITGGSGLLGRYLRRELAADEVLTVGRNAASDIVCDLTVAVPQLPADSLPELVIHAAGTEEDTDPFPLNLEGTRNLLKGLAQALDSATGATPLRGMVYVSSEKVYPSDAGVDIDEESNTWAGSKAGQSKALAEKEVIDWCRKRGVTLTILRPATMFGTGMKGPAHEMFNEVVSGRYVHIRGNEARISCVTAYDVAKACRTLAALGGIYNLSDGNAYTYIDLANAMSANAGAMKRMTYLPPKWADTIRRFGWFLPVVRHSLDPEKLARRENTLVLSNRKALEAGLSFHSVDKVLKREDTEYPYEDA